MVRLALLAVLVSACLAAAPAAQAVGLPVDLQASAGAAVEQAQSLAGTAVTAANAPPPATPEVNAPTATPSVGTVAEVAQPAAAPPEYTTAAAAPVIADRPPHADGDPPVRAARFKQGNGDTGSRAAQAGRRAALGRHSGDTTVPTPAVHRAPHATGAGPKQPPGAPDRAPPTSGGGAASSAPAAALSLGGGLALLAAAVCLAGPRLRRRLLIQPAALRPVAFVSLLERPG
jgi:hypothetical protein